MKIQVQIFISQLPVTSILMFIMLVEIHHIIFVSLLFMWDIFVTQKLPTSMK